MSNLATMVPTAMVGGSNSSSAVGSRNKSGSGPSSSEALFGVVASDNGSVWVKSGSGAIAQRACMGALRVKYYNQYW